MKGVLWIQGVEERGRGRCKTTSGVPHATPCPGPEAREANHMLAWHQRSPNTVHALVQGSDGMSPFKGRCGFALMLTCFNSRSQMALSKGARAFW